MKYRVKWREHREVICEAEVEAESEVEAERLAKEYQVDVDEVDAHTVDAFNTTVEEIE